MLHKISKTDELEGFIWTFHFFANQKCYRRKSSQETSRPVYLLMSSNIYKHIYSDLYNEVSFTINNSANNTDEIFNKYLTAKGLCRDNYLCNSQLVSYFCKSPKCN